MPDGSFGIVSKQNGRHITYLMSNRVILLKGLISPLPMLLGGSICENNLQEVMAWESFSLVAFDLYPLLQG